MNTNTQTLDYSVVIRTLGTSGEKYEALLHAIDQQTVKPREVIVVIANGYTASPYHSKYERVVWTRKGMVNQRVVGIREAKSPLLLVVDDDVSFEPDFVEKMYEKMKATKADCIYPCCYSAVGGKKALHDIKDFFLGIKRYSQSKNSFYLRIGVTAGYIKNIAMHNDEQHWCQTANFQCFLIRRDIAKDVHFEEEMWLEDTGYAWPDDQVFFYKSYLNGGKILFVPQVMYRHLDAGAGKVKVNRTYKDNYLFQRNITIFWYRFLWKYAKGTWRHFQLIAGLTFKIVNATLFFVLKCIVRREFGILFKGLDGFRDAVKYIKGKF